MERFNVFIASSSEGNDVTMMVQELLIKGLGDKARVKPWTRAFELSAAYIESLEKACERADFAVLVLTRDDVVNSRKESKSAPRDNVIFEMGLFMGALGRERCFVIQERAPEKSPDSAPELKIPSDLLGVHFAGFRRPQDDDLEAALSAQCLAICRRINQLNARTKLSKEMLAAHASIRSFCSSIEGLWWERVQINNAFSLSFFEIGFDPFLSCVFLDGKTYAADGNHGANWKSILARVDKDQFTILYHWQGWHTHADAANIPFHGFGEVKFDRPAEAGEPVTRGSGKFWNVDESQPENTAVRPVQLHRVLDPNAVSTMRTGSEKAIATIIQQTLANW